MSAISIGSAGIYNTIMPSPVVGGAVPLQVDSTGAQYTNNGGRKHTYAAVSNSTTIATFTAAAGDIATLSGSASQIIRVSRIEVSLSTSGTAALETVSLIKRSTANSGGTFLSMIAVPHNSVFPAATASALLYTAAPTLGTAVGFLRSVQFNDQSAAAPGSATWIWTFGDGRGGSSAPLLNGVAESICVNLSGVVATQSAAVSFEWTEE